MGFEVSQRKQQFDIDHSGGGPRCPFNIIAMSGNPSGRALTLNTKKVNFLVTFITHSQSDPKRIS